MADYVPSEKSRIEAEWKAWRQVCRQIRALKPAGDDVLYDPLICAVRVWAEELHALRLNAPHTLKLKVARAAYERHRIYGPEATDTEDKS